MHLLVKEDPRMAEVTDVILALWNGTSGSQFNPTGARLTNMS